MIFISLLLPFCPLNLFGQAVVPTESAGTITDGQFIQWSTAARKYVATSGVVTSAITQIDPGANTGPTVTFATGTTGTDVNVAGGANTVTFHVPTASATIRGALASADWSTFNNKQPLITTASCSAGDFFNSFTSPDTFGCDTPASGGTSVEVNGGGALASANLDDASPAAPAGAVNVAWQESAGDVSASVTLDSAYVISKFDSGACSGYLKSDGTCDTPTATLPSGLIVFIASGTCPAGFSEVAGLDGFFVLGTVAANADVGDTGGSTSYTPTGTNSTPTFTGTPFSDIINHTHPVVDPGHIHDENGPTSASGGSQNIATDTNSSGSADSGLNTGSATTGVTTSNPVGGVASITPAGTVSAPTFTGDAATITPPFIKLIGCESI